MSEHFIAATHDTDPHLLIGRLSAITGATCKAIRHYEALGLLPTPARRGKYRVYSDRDVFLVHMIKFAQGFGFGLAELRELVAARVAGGRFPLAMANALCEEKRAAVRTEVDALLARDREIVAMQVEMNRIFGEAREPDPALDETGVALATTAPP